MGFWGTLLVARSDRSLTELDALRELADTVLWHGKGEGGWQVLQLYRAPENWVPPMTGADDREDLLTAVMTQTGSPVLAAIVLDSDGAQLIGHSPRAGRWSGWLKLEVLVDYLGWQYREHLEVDDDEELPDDLDAFWEERYREACRPLYELVPPADVAAPHAVAWAVEAGYAPAVEEVEAVLAGGEAFAEDQFLNLLLALGLPTPPPAGGLLADGGQSG